MQIQVCYEELVIGVDNMKNILFISPTGTLDNGAEISITNLMSYLKQLGHRIHNIAPDNSHESRRLYEAKMIANGIHVTFLPFLNWWWEDSPSTLFGTLEERAFFYQQYVYIIRNHIREHNIDIVISNTANLFQGAVAAACESVIHFWLIHEFPTEEFAYYKDYIPFIEAMSDKIFAVDGALYETLLELVSNKEKLTTFIPFSEIDSQELGRGQVRRIVSIGKINENKNQIELLKAYINLNHLNIPLVFIGGWEDSEKEKLDSLICEYGLENVLFLGHKYKPWDWVTDQDICVLSSKSESLSLVYIEAILKGVPVIASDNLGHQTVNRLFKIGKMYPVGNIDELVDRLSSYLDDYISNKQEAVEHISFARKLFTIEKTSQLILNSIKFIEFSSPKLLLPLKDVIGAFNPDARTWLKHNQKLTLYSANADGIFSQENSRTFDLMSQASLDMAVRKEDYYFRFDLSERFGISARIKLYSPRTGEYLEPIAHNALFYNDTYHFYDCDPQICFNVSKYRGQTIQLCYELVGYYEGSKGYYQDRVIQHYLNDLSAIKEELLIKEIEIENYRRELSTIYQSRSWRIRTAIVEFFKNFRRKK